MSTLKSTDILVAAEGARRFAAQFRDMFKFVDVLAEIGNVEQAAEKAQAKVDALKKEHAQVIADVNAQKASAKAEADRMLAEAEALKIKAKEQADSHVVEGQKKAQAAAIIADAQVLTAQQRAEQIVKEAHEHAAKHEADTKSRLQNMTVAVDRLEDEHERLTKAIAAKNTEHQKITGMIADIKAKLG